MDGKHIRIRCPSNTNSVFFNYKGYYSKVLFALVDADYQFIWVQVGAQGAASDGQIFNVTELREMCENGEIGFPEERPLVDGERKVPYYIVADDAFPLKTYLMKPYSRKQLSHEERIFNYRLSRARFTVENAFGIMASRFQCLYTALRQQTSTLDSIILCCVVLHNLLRSRRPGPIWEADFEDENHILVPGAWRRIGQLESVASGNTGGNQGIRPAKDLRTYLTNYFNSDSGRVDWQDEMVPINPAHGQEFSENVD